MFQADQVLLFLTSDFPPRPGGLSTYSHGLATHFAEYFKKVIVLVAREQSEERTRDGNPALVQVFVGRSYALKVIKLLFYALKITRTEGVRMVMASSWSPCGVVACMLSCLTKTRYYLGAHGLDILEPLRSRKFRLLMGITMRGAERVFAVSDFTRQRLEELKVERGKIAVIPNGVDFERFAKTEDVKDLVERHELKGKKILLTVGRLVRRKGHDLVIEALRILASKYDDVSYVIVGEGPERMRLEEMARRYLLTDRVIFAGYVSDQELPKYYQMCDVFVMPVRELLCEGDVEGFGIVFLEASVCAKPVIGSKSGGVTEAVVDGKTGLLIEPENTSQLIAAIERLIRDEKLSRQLGYFGRERVLSELTWRDTTRRMVDEMLSC